MVWRQEVVEGVVEVAAAEAVAGVGQGHAAGHHPHQEYGQP